MTKHYCNTCFNRIDDEPCAISKSEIVVKDKAEPICEAYLRRRPFDVISSDIGYLFPGDRWISSTEYPAWYPKLVELEEQVEELLHSNPDAHFYIQQVKEKYGCLEIFFSASNNIYHQIDALVDELRLWTNDHCYECGEPATHYSTGWLLYYCEKCAHRLHDAANERHKTDFSFDTSYRKRNEKFPLI